MGLKILYYNAQYQYIGIWFETEQPDSNLRIIFENQKMILSQVKDVNGRWG